MICKDERTRKCRGRGQIANGVFTLIKRHCHPPVEVLQDVSNLVRVLYRATMDELRPVKNIFLSLKDLYPQATQELDQKQMLCRMARWRADLKPPIPETYVEVKDTLYSDAFKVHRVHNHGAVTVSLKIENDVSVTLVFWDDVFLPKLAACTELHIITTARVLPENLEDTEEFVTVVAVRDNHAFACVRAWTRTRGSGAYSAILEPLRNVLHPREVYANFDARIHAAVTEKFPNATARGDFWNYCTAVLQEVKRQQLDIASDLEVRSTVKKLLGLALLPPQAMQEMFVAIRDAVGPANADTLTYLFEYIETTWLEGVKPQGFSFYRNDRAILDIGCTTVQDIENVLRGKKHTWNFIHVMLGIQSRSYDDVQRLDEEKTVTATPRVRSLISKVEMHRLWSLLASETVTARRFLEMCSNLLEQVLADMLFLDEPLVNDFQPIIGQDEDTDDPDAMFPPLNIGGDDNHNGQLVGNAAIVYRQVDAAQLPDRENAMETAEELEWTCAICKVNAIEYGCMPCFHINFCQECSDRCVQEATRDDVELTCPLCRAPVTNFARAFFPMRNIV